MTLTRLFGFVLSIMMVVTVLSSVSSAQRSGPLRWLGQGFSDGYHRCNPGPNSDYYCPYSATNSVLVSQSPDALRAYQNRQNQLQQHPRTIDLGVPFSIYASPARPTHNDFVPAHGQPLDHSFHAPGKPETLDVEVEVQPQIDAPKAPQAPEAPKAPQAPAAQDDNSFFPRVRPNSTPFQTQPSYTPAGYRTQRQPSFDPFATGK